MKRFISLKIKFVLFFIILIGISIFIVTAVLSQKTSDLIMDRLELESTDKTKLVASYLDKKQVRLAAITKSLAILYDVQPGAAQRLFSSKLQLDNFSEKSAVSKVRIFSQLELISVDVTNYQVLKIAQKVYQRGIPFSGFVGDEKEGYRFVAFYPLLKRGKLIYICENFKNDFLYEMQTLANSQISIFDSKGQSWKSTVFKRDGLDYFHDFSVPPKKIKKLIEQPGSYTEFELTILGFKYVVSLQGIYDYGNRLIGSFGSMVLEYDAYEDLNDNYFVSIRAALMIFVFMGLIAFYFISKIVRAYKEISIMSLEIAHGNLNKRITRIPNDELGEMIISVNMMADSVKSSLELKKTLAEKLRNHQLARGLSAEQMSGGQHYLREKPVFVEEDLLASLAGPLLPSLAEPLLVLGDDPQNGARISRNFKGPVDIVCSQKVLLEKINAGGYQGVLVDVNSIYTPLKMLILKRKYPQLAKVPIFYG